MLNEIFRPLVNTAGWITVGWFIVLLGTIVIVAIPWSIFLELFVISKTTVPSFLYSILIQLYSMLKYLSNYRNYVLTVLASAKTYPQIFSRIFFIVTNSFSRYLRELFVSIFLYQWFMNQNGKSFYSKVIYYLLVL
jgi:hypothetical protein